MTQRNTKKVSLVEESEITQYGEESEIIWIKIESMERGQIKIVHIHTKSSRSMAGL